MNTSVAMTGQQQQQQQCVAPMPLPSGGPSDGGEVVKSVYRVGILALRGNDHAFHVWGPMMEYLDLAVGAHFQEPLQFKIVPLSFADVFDAIRANEVDFFYVNPSMFSCMETELQASPLATVISDRLGYDLEQYAGVIFARANETNDIHTLPDLQGTRIAATDIAELGSGQMQFRAMRQAGLHHLQDPAQVLFTHDQLKVVDAVATGQADVGFVRTDLLERLENPREGPSINIEDFKIIGQLEDLQTSRGVIFPFPASTELYPEWAFASMPGVATSVARSVQSSLLDIADHASIAPSLLSCYESVCNAENDGENSNNISAPLPQSQCHEFCLKGLNRTLFRLYDTTPDLALAAHAAMVQSRVAGFRPSLSYMSIRDMQEVTGYTSYDIESKQAHCIQSQNLTDAVVCPTGYIKRSEQEILEGCSLAGIPCHGFQCLCSPCRKKEDPRDMLALVLPTSALVVIACVLFLLLRKKLRADRYWMLRKEDIVYTNSRLRDVVDPASAPMLLADYKGTRVIVKSVLLPLTGDLDVTSRSIDPLDSLNQRKPLEQPSIRHTGSESGILSIQPEALAPDAESGDPYPRPIDQTPGAEAQSTAEKGSPAMASFSGEKMTSFLQALVQPGKFGTKAVDRAKLQKLFIAEMKRISKLRHPYIATVLGSVVSKDLPEPLLIVEYMELGSLSDLLHTNPGIRRRSASLPLLHDIVRGLRFLHASGIVNGDLCARHVLIDSNYRAKLSSCQLSAKNLIARADRRPTGNNLWMAPEILRHETYNTAESDMYAFGVLLYEIFSMTPPYEGEDHHQVLLQVADKTIQKRLPIPRDCPQEAAELMVVCFREEPEHRPTAMEIDIRMKMLDLDTIMHKGIMNAMQSSQFSDTTLPPSLSPETSAHSRGSTL